MTPIHRPILVEPIVDFLTQAPIQRVFDLTCGEGGHTEALLSARSDLRVLGVDRDPEILARARERLAAFKTRTYLKQARFSELSEADWTHDTPLGILADFGISSFHFDTTRRGFAFRDPDAPLDMRLNPEDSTTAADLLNELDSEPLANLIFRFGEERFSRRIARAIVSARNEDLTWTTGRLADLVKDCIPRKAWPPSLHPATRTFQALRIAVNGELDEIESLLKTLSQVLRTGDRVAFLTFHSLEDRPIKQFFQAHRKNLPQPDGWHPDDGEPPRLILEPVSRKPMLPSSEEVAENPRARSAKLRMAKVIADASQSVE